jgi:RNA polymerase sigma-70 factor, ECF subfamily
MRAANRHNGGDDDRQPEPGGNFLAPQRVLNSVSLAVSDDAQLIDEALHGHSEAFGQLVLKYQDRLFNTVFHVIGHAEDARDVVQEALVQAFLKLDTFRSDSAFYTWLYRIAFNVAVTHRRRQRPTTSMDSAGEMGMEPSDAQNDPAENLQRKERCGQVRLAIARLAEEYRAVVVLREIDGCCYEAISEVLDLPVGTVRSRLHRARLQLREHLHAILVAEGAKDRTEDQG